MKAQFEVNEILWGKVRVASLLKSKAIGELLTPILEREFGGLEGLPNGSRVSRKQGKEASKVVGGGLVGVEPPKPIPAVSVTFEKGQSPLNPEMPEAFRKSGGKVAFGVPVDPTAVPMAKCRKCGESFPVADMVTEPKSGKLFCGDCVENMKNGQA